MFGVNAVAETEFAVFYLTGWIVSGVFVFSVSLLANQLTGYTSDVWNKLTSISGLTLTVFWMFKSNGPLPVTAILTACYLTELLVFTGQNTHQHALYCAFISFHYWGDIWVHFTSSLPRWLWNWFLEHPADLTHNCHRAEYDSSIYCNLINRVTYRYVLRCLWPLFGHKIIIEVEDRCLLTVFFINLSSIIRSGKCKGSAKMKTSESQLQQCNYAFPSHICVIDDNIVQCNLKDECHTMAVTC